MNPSKVLIRRSDLEYAIDEVKNHAEDHEETGVAFLGEIKQNKVYIITKVVGAGPKAQRGNVSFTTDEKSISDALKHEIRKNSNARYLGDGHSHPWPSRPEPSSIDLNQLRCARKSRPWFIIAVFSSIGETGFFGLDKDQELFPIPYQIISDDFDEKDLLARIDQITDNEILSKIRVGILGAGSLASGVVAGLAGSGIKDYAIGDMDKLETVNLVRHIGGINDIDKSKADILSDYIQSHNPLASVQTVEDDLIKNRDLLRAIIESCDIIVAASGNPELNYHINTVCLELGKPAVYGGIYPAAKSAYVLCVPTKSHCCFDCMFDLTTTAVDQNTLKRKYGLKDGELKEAQGMFADIIIPGSMMAKMTLWLLLGKEFVFNFVRYYDDLKVERVNVPKRELCATCDYENWLRLQEEKTKTEESERVGFVKKIGRKFRGLRK